ncbi:MAG: PCMD domain-containing protein [Prevotella sp.]|nr:PCMD domain-containing protein [Prevotella sp.]
MKHPLMITLIGCSCLVFSSCFKEEARNAECDVLAVSVQPADPLSVFYHATDTLQTLTSADSVAIFPVRWNHAGDLSTLQPHFVLTPGATISKMDGSVDAAKGGVLHYRTTSEDEVWHRYYTVVFKPDVMTENDTLKFDFENYELESREKKYYVWLQPHEDGLLYADWASGNGGFRMSMGSVPPEAYPTVPVKEGFDGACVKLVTSSTGAFGQMAHKPIAAGNLFLGSFDATSAVLDPMRATHFGVVVSQRPVTLSGYYQYRPGATYQDENEKTVTGAVDSAAVYAVLYRNHDDKTGQPITLYGDNVKTSSQVVAIADMGYVKPTSEWTAFSVDFKYDSDIDWQLLSSRGYSMAVVFSSSNEGDKFRGAIGSTLLIDKVRVVCKKEQ